MDPHTTPVLSCVRSQLLASPNPSFFFQADIGPDEDLVAFIDRERLFVQGIGWAPAREIPFDCPEPFHVASIKRNVVAAICSTENSVYSATSRQGAIVCQTLQHNGYPTPEDCTLAPSAAVGAALFTHQNYDTSEVLVFNPSNSHIVSKWKVPSYSFRVGLSPDAHFVFLLQRSQKGCFLTKHELHSGFEFCSTQVSPGPEDGLCIAGFSSNAHGSRVVVADSESLRIWEVRHPGTPEAYHLPDYTPQHSYVCINRKYPIDLIACAISQDGSRVVAAIAGNKFGIWDTERRTRIAILAGHTDIPCKCAISSDGTSIFTVGLDRKFCQWAMPTETTGALPLATTTNTSPLESAIATALHNPSQLDEAFLLKHVRSHNVNTPSDLLAGHNLVLLSIRAHIITRDNIRRLGNSTWYLEDNLYHPATKLAIANAPLIDKVFQHAESVGIISNGYAFKIARGIRTDANDDKSKLANFIAKWLRDIDQRVSALESRTSAVERNMDTAFSALGSMYRNEQNLNKAVRGLSESLDKLQAAIRKKDKITKRVQIARCLMSFVPLVGKALGETTYSLTEVFMNLKLEDLVPAGVETAKATLTEMFNVDLSNFRVAQVAFSNEALSKLGEPARNAVTSAIEKSGFRSSDQLERILADEIKSMGDAEPSMHLLDIGSSGWLTVGDESSGSSSSEHSRSLDEGARKYFQWKTHANEDRTMSIEEAKEEVNKFLETCQGLSVVAPETLENLFFEIASEDAEVVNEEVFVGMFRAVRNEQEESKQRERLLEEYAKRFRMRARPGKSLSIKFAARMVRNLWKEKVNQRVAQEAPMEYEQVLEKLRKFDADKNGTIEEEEFLTAMQALLQEEKAPSS